MVTKSKINIEQIHCLVAIVYSLQWHTTFNYKIPTSVLYFFLKNTLTILPCIHVIFSAPINRCVYRSLRYLLKCKLRETSHLIYYVIMNNFMLICFLLKICKILKLFALKCSSASFSNETFKFLFRNFNRFNQLLECKPTIFGI